MLSMLLIDLKMKNIHSKKILSIIQARMTSSRLPGKVLFKIGNSTILKEVINKAKIFSEQVIVCTSNDSSDDEIYNYCQKINILCSRGELSNVFNRYRNTFGLKNIENCDWFARLTADNPLISINLANILINQITPSLDYIAYEKLIPNGSGIELINKKTFLNIDENLLDEAQKEHVTPIFYENCNKFNCLFIKPPTLYRIENLRITIDYEEDYQLLKKLYEIKKSITLEEVINIFNKDNALFKINRECVQKTLR
tara:strand:- start:3223 stop:3987 length:765 start_codon:yes stop_codon:yes gene_type:complete